MTNFDTDFSDDISGRTNDRKRRFIWLVWPALVGVLTAAALDLAYGIKF